MKEFYRKLASRVPSLCHSLVQAYCPQLKQTRYLPLLECRKKTPFWTHQYVLCKLNLLPILSHLGPNVPQTPPPQWPVRFPPHLLCLMLSLCCCYCCWSCLSLYNLPHNDLPTTIETITPFSFGFEDLCYFCYKTFICL